MGNNGDSKQLKKLLGLNFRQMRGPRTLATIADRMGCTHQRVSQIENGDVPESYLYLVRLREEEGVDLNELMAVSSEKEDR